MLPLTIHHYTFLIPYTLSLNAINMLKKLNRINSNRNELRPIKILQFGDGNFLRGFADWVIDVLNEKTGFNGDVQIIRPQRKNQPEIKDDQDGLYHVVLNGLQNGKIISETRLISCVSDYINPYVESDRFLKAAENPNLLFIISNTTEAGIVFNASDLNPNVVHESFPAKTTMLLYHRFKFFLGDTTKGVIFLPCELIEKNGDALKKVIIEYSRLWNLELDFDRWLTDHNTFCNSLVDRIVTGFPKDSINEVQSATGFEDNHVVSAEPFHLWVIEAPPEVIVQFPAEKAGLSVKFVDDLAPYRTSKVRILNGAHTALVPVAYLRGLRTVRESVEDRRTGEFIRAAIFDEIIPSLDLSTEELDQFAKDVLERFQNPFIKHELKSIALNSISKFKVRVLPTIVEYKKRKGNLPEHLIYSFAALIRFYKGDWQGEPIPLNDTPEAIAFFTEVWKQTDTVGIVNKVLSNSHFWEKDLTKIDGLSESIVKAMGEIENEISKISMS